MKIRNGFVSNSSSSSFVVLFPREPKNADDVKTMLFKDEKFYFNPYDEGGWPVETVAQTVWSDICEQKKNDFGRAEYILSSGTIDDVNAPDYDNFRHITGDKKWEAYHDAMAKYGKQKLKEFFNVRKLKLKKINNEEEIDGAVLYCFSYADEDGSYGSALEHGDLFRRLKHIQVSNH